MQLVEILSYSNKIKTVDDLLNNFDSVAELARDDIHKIAKSKRLFFSDFDFVYGDAVKMLKGQLNKSHLKGIRRFLSCENIANAVSWLIERILNNMRNITTNRKYKLYCSPSFRQFNDNIKSNDEIKMMLDLMEIEKFDSDTLKNGLQRLWNDSIHEEDFDCNDIKYLCEKFEFEVSEIMGTQAIYLQNYKKEQTESGNSQLVFVFESEIA